MKLRQTVTLWVEPTAVVFMDEAAKRNGMSRQAFVKKCANAGYKALKKAGEIK